MKISKITLSAICIVAVTSIVSIHYARQVNAEQAPASTGQYAKAVFAGGCFWCMEPPYDKIDGVISTISGYTGGHIKNPTYKQVSSTITGHVEAIEITYDPTKVDYNTLLDVFWRNVDPTRDDGQFCDRGAHYRPVIFFKDNIQKQIIDKSLQDIKANKPFPDPVKVDILAEKTFYPAEEHHQDYYLKNPVRYKFYRYSCGRDQRLEQLWGKK